MTDQPPPTNDAPAPNNGATPAPTNGVTPPAAPAPPEAPKVTPLAAPESGGQQPSRIAQCIAEARARGRHPEIAAILGFLIPGLGHVYLGKYFKGVVAFVFLIGLFTSGLFVTRGECVSLDRDRGHFYAFFAQVGCGLPTGLALLRSHGYEVKKWFGGDPEPPVNEDVESEAFIARLPKLDEGLLYTMIAGLLNLLLIHDALLGAPGALLRRDREGLS